MDIYFDDALGETAASFSQKQKYRGNVVEIGGEQRLIVKHKGKIPGHCKNILEGNFCTALMPMSFMKKGNDTIIYYNLSDCLTLDEYLKNWKGVPHEFAGEVIRILSLLIKALKEAEEWLMPAKYFALTPDMIFINIKTYEVKISYFETDTEIKSVKEQISELVKALENYCVESRWAVYANGIRREISEKNMGLKGILALLKEKESQINLYKWDEQEKEKEILYERMWSNEEKVKVKRRFSWLLKK